MRRTDDPVRRGWTRRPLRRPIRAPLLLAALGSLLTGACAEREQGPPPATAAVLDSFLVELGQLPAAELDRDQRWRMISSIWVGLPPPGYTRDSLPEPGSHSAALLQAYCVQCHWMPSPQMHSAAEWPLLVHRMLLRARAVGERLGGPLTREIVGSDRVVEGMGITRLPSPEEMDSITAYLRSHALPVAEEGRIPTGADAEVYVRQCSLCHETPSPDAHAAGEWPDVVSRMIRNMSLMGLEPLAERETEAILRFLREEAPGGEAGGAGAGS